MDLYPVIRKAFDKTKFRTLDTGGEKPRVEGDRLIIPPALLTKTAEECFKDIAFYFRESHLDLISKPLGEASTPDNDRQVLKWLLENAVISSKGELTLCQDTGTAIIYGWKDEGVYSGGEDTEALEEGAAAAYKKNHLRASMTAASSFFGEFNTKTNLPAQFRIEATHPGSGKPAFRFLFVAKGGGSSNKTSLFAMTKALLEKDNFEAFLREKIASLGTAACPPYRLAFFIGGTSPELNLEVLKLATCEALDDAPYFPEGEEIKDGSRGWIWRDKYWEERAMQIARETGFGAQFGGENLLLDVRILRMPRHAAACPVSMGVNCIAHRNMMAYIDSDGVHVEQLAQDPAAFLQKKGIDLSAKKEGGAEGIRINLEKPIKEICAELTKHKVGTMLLLSGKILVARDAAHLKWHTLLKEGKPLPEYLPKYIIYYAGPSATPPGKIIGSLGPTTAGRMDPYGDAFMNQGFSLITLAKGNRSEGWKQACAKYGGFYLGGLGGGAALLAEENVIGDELVDYPELGMEAVRLITVKDLPAFILIDDKNNSLY